MNHDSSPRLLTRRDILGGIGMSLLVAPLSQVIACGSGNHHGGKQGGNGAAAPWATGGTAAMTAASAYPDPFAAGPGTACKMTCKQVLGPCYTPTIDRKDISEGQDGLPLRLAFLVLDESCKPIQGAKVDIWHSSPAGVYSGKEYPDDAKLKACTYSNPAATAARWFRGLQTTDASGRVDFDTCFPGWYPHRAVHIHLTISIGDAAFLTTQVYFDDALLDEVIATQPLYNTRGERDTRNPKDLCIAEDQVADFTLQIERMSDGAMLAWKTFILRSSTATELCDANSQCQQEILKNGSKEDDIPPLPLPSICSAT